MRIEALWKTAGTLLIALSATAVDAAGPTETKTDFQPGRQDQKLADKLLPLIRAHRGRVAVAVKHLNTGQRFAHRDSEVMPTASLIKLAVMIETYRRAEAGTLDLAAPVELREEDKVPGSGILTRHLSAGVRLPLRDAVRLMMAYSDNTATNLVLGQVGLASINASMERLNCPNTKMHALVFRRDTSILPQRSRQFGLGSTTAAETIRLLEMLHGRQLAGPNATREMLDHLRSCEDDDKLASELPAGFELAHKSGAVSKVRCDAGLLLTPDGPVALCVLTSDNEDRSWSDSNEANRLCGKIGRTVAKHFSPAAVESAAPQVLSEGSGGRLVEDLQRTLNARLRPTPDLALDGDFGPATKSAVQRFQESKRLPANGLVEAATWRALGPLLTSDPPAPRPAVVNAQTLPRRPADPLDGAPHVSCKAWLVLDRETGQTQAAHQADKRLDIASTTKIMTAYVILDYARRHPQSLDEEVVFSRRADQTSGSTAGIREGEKLPVRELLYGLLLPSGNDASVALAEHFGAHLAGDGGDTETDPLSRFVAEMNRTAGALGLEKTHFENPHGLTAKGHQSTARDLATLADCALKLPPLRDYVATRQHGCTLQSTSGYTRDVVWKNTNRLLETEGYEGVKTGTTTAAGACLVSTERRGEGALLVVVLGSACSSSRYTDTRNLFRWAWNQRAVQAEQVKREQSTWRP